MNDSGFQKVDPDLLLPLIPRVNLVELAVAPRAITEDMVCNVRQQVSELVPFVIIYADFIDNPVGIDQPTYDNRLLKYPPSSSMILVQGHGALQRNQDIHGRATKRILPLESGATLQEKTEPPLLTAFPVTNIGTESFGMKKNFFGDSYVSSLIAPSQCQVILAGRSPQKQNPVIRIRDLVGNTYYRICLSGTLV